MSCPRLFEPVDDQHLATCAECRAVRDALAASTAEAPPDLAGLEQLKGPALAELQLTPRARAWWAGAMGFLVLSTMATGLAMWLLPANTVQHGSPSLRQVSAAAWAVAMLAGGFLAVMPGGRGLRRALMLAVMGCFALTLFAASGHDPGFGGAGCALTEGLIALLPLAVALLVLTGFAFDGSRAVAAGVAATSAGLLAVHLHCPNGTLPHQGLFHLAPIVLLAAATVLLRRLLPSRTYAP